MWFKADSLGTLINWGIFTVPSQKQPELGHLYLLFVVGRFLPQQEPGEFGGDFIRAFYWSFKHVMLKVHTCHLYWLLDVNMSYSWCFLVIFDSTGSSQRDLDAQKSELNISRRCLSKVSACLRAQIESRKCLKLQLPSPRDVSSLSPHFSKLQFRLWETRFFRSSWRQVSSLHQPSGYCQAQLGTGLSI